MNIQRLLTIVLGGMLLSACAQFAPYRTSLPAKAGPKYFECVVDGADRSHPGLPLCDPSVLADPRTARADWPPNCTRDDKDVGKERQRCEDPATQAIQHRFYSTNDHQEGDYYLSFVEFDDQGWFADRKQMEALFVLLQDLEKKDKATGGHTLIRVYAHGWKHNASACDNNVLCFSRLLERTDLAEKGKEVMYAMQGGSSRLTEAQRQAIAKQTPEMQKLQKGFVMMQYAQDLKQMDVQDRQKELDKIKPRTVVGVYLGWRGLPFDSALNNLSFWSRKDTAARVGSGGVFELLTRLKDYRDGRQSDDSPNVDGESENTNKTQLMITGHSFGGLVIYSALSHALMERATRTWRPAKTDGSPGPAARYGMARSFGDFVLLVNPAFEGSLYEPLFNIATNRCYSETQRPVMMIVTSKADKATGIAFPIGRAMDTLFQHKGSAEQGGSMRQTIGHNERYQTHDLKLEGGRNTLDDKYVAKSNCDCPHLRPISQMTLEQMQDDSFGAMLDDTYGNGLSLVPVQNAGPDGMTDSRHGGNPKYARNYPYLVVTTDASVIADHNAIYNGNFSLFSQQFFEKHIARKQPLSLGADPVACWREPDEAGGLVPAERSLDYPPCHRGHGVAMTQGYPPGLAVGNLPGPFQSAKRRVAHSCEAPGG